MYVGDIKRVNISGSSFEYFIMSNSVYIDKTRLIEHFLTQSSQVHIVCRQRRLGKSLNLDTLYCFLTDAADYRHLFKDLYISKSPVWPLAHSTPTFLFNLKSMSVADYKTLIRGMVDGYIQKYLKVYPCPEHLTEKMQAWKNHATDGSEGFRLLVDLAASINGSDMPGVPGMENPQKPILLIDEYDNLLMEVLDEHAKYLEVRNYLTNLLSAAIKDNRNLGRVMLTGCTRISHEGMLSGLNNPDTFDVFEDELYTDDYGFTEEEMTQLCNDAGIDIDEARKWYNGVLINGKPIYNTFGVMNYIKKGKTGNYWGQSGNLNRIVSMLTPQRRRTILLLLEGGASLDVKITARLSPDRLLATIEDETEDTDADFYSFLVQAGYLALSDFKGSVGTIAIPNHELRLVWQEFIFSRILTKGARAKMDLLDADDLPALCERLQTYLKGLLDFLSFNDLPSNLYDDGKLRVDEILYQHFVYGIFAALKDSLGFDSVKSNRESGDGRYDISLEARRQAFVIELKTASRDEDLAARANEALKQIKKKRYAAEFPGKYVVAIGMSFRKKDCAVAAEEIH